MVVPLKGKARALALDSKTRIPTIGKINSRNSSSHSMLVGIRTRTRRKIASGTCRLIVHPNRILSRIPGTRTSSQTSSQTSQHFRSSKLSRILTESSHKTEAQTSSKDSSNSPLLNFRVSNSDSSPSFRSRPILVRVRFPIRLASINSGTKFLRTCPIFKRVTSGAQAPISHKIRPSPRVHNFQYSRCNKLKHSNNKQ